LRTERRTTAAFPTSPPRATPREIARTISTARLPGRPRASQFNARRGNKPVRSV